jgi:hypothetical protein
MKKGCGSMKKNGYMGGGMVSPRKAMAMGYMDGGMVGKKKGYQMGGMVKDMTPQQAMTMGRDLAAKMAGMRNQPMSSGGMRPMMRKERLV